MSLLLTYWACVLQTPKGYCGAYTEDARVAVRHVRDVIGVSLTHTASAACLFSDLTMLVFALQDEAPLIALGYSLGANIMLKYVGEGTYYAGKTNISAVMQGH
jgi:predicted alpha/beta-fold hydrolase